MKEVEESVAALFTKTKRPNDAADAQEIRADAESRQAGGEPQEATGS